MDEQSADGTQGSDHHAHRREREIAIRQILEVISRSRDDEQPVFDVILENAANICNAPLAYLCMATEDRSAVTCPARRGAFAKFGETLDNLQVPLVESRLALARAINECEVFREDDITDNELYTSGDPDRVSMVEDEGARSLLVVPLVSDGRGVGSITLYRRETMPFSDDDVSLVESFAAQAVIAIENVRQFRELQARLEREAASAEILKVISQSRDDEGPVFEAILENAARLCNAPIAFLSLASEDRTEVLIPAHRGTRSEFGSILDGFVEPITRTELVAIRPIVEGKVTREDDIKDHETYRKGDPRRRQMVDVEGARSVLGVPLMRGSTAVGAIILYRREVQPFTEDDVSLIEAFAAQAVIAIENVRQFRALEALNAELGDRVEEQVGEIERMGRLKRFLSPAVADAVVTKGEEMLSSHRALIATLFCDIRGFTAFCETAEPEETIEVLQTYHEELGTLISDYGGGVDKRIGDGIMVIFNDPLPVEDPASDAVRLAIAMHARMAELCKNWKRLGHGLGFGVGVAFGYATVGMVGSAGRFDYTANGSSVNLAARLCDQAADGETLISPRAQIAVEGDFPTESLGEMSFKGIHKPIEVFRLKQGW